MTLEESINDHFASYIGKQCTYDGGLDTVERVHIMGKPYGGYGIFAVLEFAGTVPVAEVKLIKE